MRVLVTGGAGFIGAATARALVARGDEVRILDALTQPVHAPHAVPSIEGAGLVHGDVRDKRIWERVLDGVDAVVHCAAYQDYLPDFSTFFAVNAVGRAHSTITSYSNAVPTAFTAKNVEKSGR